MAAPIATGLLVCAPSCGSFSTSNDVVADAMTDAPVTEDVASNDAAGNATDGAATDAGPNLFPLGDFELGGCAGDGYYSSLIADSTAHGGGKSCRVCSSGMSPDVFSFDSDIDNVALPVGAHYVAEAWIRTATSAGPPANGVELTLRTHTDAPVVEHDLVFTNYTTVTQTWQLLTIELDIKEPGIPKLEVVVDGQYDSGTCFLVDDIVVRRVQ
jgi:hypothetical protein